MANVFQTARSVSLIQIINSYAGMQISGRHVNGLSCPFCGHNGCFGVYGTQRGTLDKFKCFSCGVQGNGIDFVKAAKDYSDDAASAKDICDTFGLVYEDSVPQIDPAKKDYLDVYEYVMNLFSLCYQSSYNAIPNYFESRGLSPELIKEYGLGYCPAFFMKQGKVIHLKDLILAKFPNVNADNYGLYNSYGDSVFADRYIFPIRNNSGKVIAFAGRSLNPEEPKYKNTSNNQFFSKSFALFNYDKAKSYSTVIVVEGYMDALSLIQSGVNNVVAAMGTAFGDSHMSLLKGKDIILSLDSDDAGQLNIANIIESHRDLRLRVLQFSGYKDFNEALTSCSDMKAYLKSCQLLDAPEFLIKYLKSNYDLGKLKNRSDLWIRLAKLLGNLARPGYPINPVYTPIEYDYYWKHLNRLLKGGK